MGALRYALAGLLGIAAACALFATVALPLAREGRRWGCGPDIVRRPPRSIPTQLGSWSIPRAPGCRGFPIRCRVVGPSEPFRFRHAAAAAPGFTPPGSELVSARESRFLAGADGERCGEVIPSRDMPEWPEAAMRRQVDGGSVLIALDVSERGLPRNLRVIESAPVDVFDAAALEAVARWRYCPVFRDSQPIVRENVRVRLRFEREV